MASEIPGSGKDVRSAEKSASRFLTSFLYNFSYIFNPGKPLMMMRVARNLLAANLLRRPRPRTLDLNITNQCNLRCEHCFAESFNLKAGTQPLLGIPDYRRVAAQAINMGFTSFTLTGGEPFVDDRIFDIIRAISPRKVWVACATNGTMTDGETLRKAKTAGLDAIYVSIDSMDPARHDRFRGGVPGTLDRALKTIDLAVEAGLKVAINTTITRFDLKDPNFAGIISFAERRGFLVLLNLAAPAGKWMKREELYFTDEDSLELLGILRRHPHVRTDMEANYLEWGCPSFKERLYITAFGDVLPCPFIHISFGNVRDAPLKDLIAKARRNPWFATYQPLCLASQDLRFIRKYIYRTFGRKTIPVPADEIFGGAGTD